MKKLYRMMLFCSLLPSGMLTLATEVSSNLTLASDYVYRGISQTDEEATIQGGFDVAGESGLYAGVWASNVDFDGSIEIDFYVGYGGSFTEEVEYDIGLLRYEYPDDAQGDAPESSFNELYTSLSFKGFTLGFAYSSDFFAESDKALYTSLDYEVSLPKEVTLSLHYGNQSIDDNAQFGTPDYVDYSIGISRSIEGIGVSLFLHDTDLSGQDCFGGPDDTCVARVVFGLSKSL